MCHSTTQTTFSSISFKVADWCCQSEVPQEVSSRDVLQQLRNLSPSQVHVLYTVHVNESGESKDLSVTSWWLSCKYCGSQPCRGWPTGSQPAVKPVTSAVDATSLLRLLKPFLTKLVTVLWKLVIYRVIYR